MEMSEQIDQIAEALAKANAELGHAHKDRKNPHLKNRYATLKAVIDASRPVLAKHGISLLQPLELTGGTASVCTMLMHSSGQWLKSPPTEIAGAGNKGTNSAQAGGSASSYARRYSLSSMICVASSEEDDDGNAASGAPPAPHERFDLPKALGVTPEVLDAVCAYKGWGGHGAWRGWDDAKRKLFVERHPPAKVGEYVALAAREMRDRFHARYSTKPTLKEDCGGDKAAWDEAKKAWDADRKRVLNRLYGVHSAGDLSITQAVGKFGLDWLKPENKDQCAKTFAAAAADQREAA